jgi:hypothetical protein
LTLPIEHAAKKGTFKGWLRSKGRPGGQHKVTRLSNDRIYSEEIPAINEQGM